MMRKLVLTVAAVALMAGSALADDIRVGLVPKSLGNGFFDAADKGAKEAAQQIGGVEVIYTGPTSTTAEGQIETINALIAQKVDAIAISANDPDALVPALKKAMQRGIKVISWDSGVAKAGRIVHLNPSSNQLIGEMCVQLAADVVGKDPAEVAILSATPTSTNQNIWIEEMKKVFPKFPNLKLVATVYGDDLADKSYRETQALLKQYPNLKVIIAPTSVGIVAAAKAVEDAGLTGKVFVTGLGLPSELAGHVMKGTVKSFAIWNPIDLGYSATYLAVDLVKGEKGGPDTTLSIGRLGTVTFDANGDGAMGKPFVYDKSNVEKFAKIF
ncbi:rhamnose ABC transporter substrate-binding protein [Segnochrobactrum spirostomi]|uniref:Rhamnose ABC transporter substrate-binding protein n=1 Tax=Segnochrobactrum spirostomi TaxID=2608987 RepID=A0A6A7Y0V7_9HYPH|nr:rhamnose ABC transporter substrate-binding protein [Segnochrobactrum spirostomi]MQT12594.1 rhamnose ABC transporter substrate-binding protein [Segnochrobactrum spirostomi]